MWNVYPYFIFLFAAVILSNTFIPIHAEETFQSTQYQSYSTQVQNILNLVKSNQLNLAVEQTSPSLAVTIRNLDPASKKTFAYLYNEKGIRLAKEQKMSESIACVELAVEFAPEQSVYQKNLSQILFKSGQEYYLAGNFSLAEKKLKQSLQYDSENVAAMTVLSDVYYYSQEIKKAKELIARAKSKQPNLAQIQSRFDQITQDEKLEKEMKLAETEIFDIKFSKNQGSSFYNIHDFKQTLRKTYRDVGQSLNHFPRHTIAVILYSDEDYRKLREIPEWSSGVYDGKIRIPIPSPNSVYSFPLNQIIRHEYTHAVVRDLTSGNCPIWLNEGLAEYYGYQAVAFDPTLARNAFRQGTFFSIQQLSENFYVLTNEKQIRLAYAQSYLLVRFIIDRWGISRLRRLLLSSATGIPLEKLIQTEFHMNLNRFQNEWFKYLEKKL